MQANILVVEDDHSVRNLVSTTLQTHGYQFDAMINGESALLAMTSHHYDIILLDLGLPDQDGIDIIKTVRTFSVIPIIVLSARSSNEDKIAALDAGADDYLTKPFNIDELLARVRSTLRRAEYLQNMTTQEETVFENGDLKINYLSATVSLKGKEIHLMPIEYNLLCLLAKNVGKVLTYQFILDKIWKNALESDLSSLRVYMTTLRKKIDKQYADDQKYIQTHITSRAFKNIFWLCNAYWKNICNVTRS